MMKFFDDDSIDKEQMERLLNFAQKVRISQNGVKDEKDVQKTLGLFNDKKLQSFTGIYAAMVQYIEFNVRLDCVRSQMVLGAPSQGEIDLAYQGLKERLDKIRSNDPLVGQFALLVFLARFSGWGLLDKCIENPKQMYGDARVVFFNYIEDPKYTGSKKILCQYLNGTETEPFDGNFYNMISERLPKPSLQRICPLQ